MVIFQQTWQNIESRFIDPIRALTPLRLLISVQEQFFRIELKVNQFRDEIATRIVFVDICITDDACVELSKQQQSSDWASSDLSEAQLNYAASDVLYLHAIADGLSAMLEREGRMDIARACFDFLPQRARLDLMGWDEADIFAHS